MASENGKNKIFIASNSKKMDDSTLKYLSGKELWSIWEKKKTHTIDCCDFLCLNWISCGRCKTVFPHLLLLNNTDQTKKKNYSWREQKKKKKQHGEWNIFKIAVEEFILAWNLLFRRTTNLHVYLYQRFFSFHFLFAFFLFLFLFSFFRFFFLLLLLVFIFCFVYVFFFFLLKISFFSSFS